MRRGNGNVGRPRHRPARGRTLRADQRGLPLRARDQNPEVRIRDAHAERPRDRVGETEKERFEFGFREQPQTRAVGGLFGVILRHEPHRARAVAPGFGEHPEEVFVREPPPLRDADADELVVGEKVEEYVPEDVTRVREDGKRQKPREREGVGRRGVVGPVREREGARLREVLCERRGATPVDHDGQCLHGGISKGVGMPSIVARSDAARRGFGGVAFRLHQAEAAVSAFSQNRCSLPPPMEPEDRPAPHFSS